MALSCDPVSISPVSISLRNSQGRFLPKNYTVYYGIKNGKVLYVGITRQSLKDRLSQHDGRFDRLKPIKDGLTRRQARGIEQLLIERNPHFVNAINSIATNRTWYKDAIRWAKSTLKK